MKEIKLSTEVDLEVSDWKIDYQSKILTLGSCFAEVLGAQLGNYKFDVLNNPLGTIFNPLTILWNILPFTLFPCVSNHLRVCKLPDGPPFSEDC